jgi:hypothetical protein
MRRSRTDCAGIGTEAKKATSTATGMTRPMDHRCSCLMVLERSGPRNYFNTESFTVSLDTNDRRLGCWDGQKTIRETDLSWCSTIYDRVALRRSAGPQFRLPSAARRPVSDRLQLIITRNNPGPRMPVAGARSRQKTQVGLGSRPPRYTVVGRGGRHAAAWAGACVLMS